MEWLILALFVAALAAAVRARRAIKDPVHPLGRWLRANVRPWLRDAAMVVFIATLAGWVILNVAAPEEDRKDLQQIFKEFWAPVGQGKAPPLPGTGKAGDEADERERRR